MTTRSARRREQLDLATSLRDAGRSPTEIGRELRERYDQNPLAAMRLAHGWSQADAAAAWNARWPDAPRTFKNFSYWENWPGPTGHAPSLAVLDALAELYGCAVSDLLGGWGDHRDVRPSQTAEPAALAWQVRHLNLNELVHAVTRWGLQLPDERRRADLLKLSTAAAAARRACRDCRGSNGLAARHERSTERQRPVRAVDQHLQLSEHEQGSNVHRRPLDRHHSRGRTDDRPEPAARDR